MAGDCDGIPNQYFFTLAGQFFTATFNSTTNEVTFASEPGGIVSGEPVIFYPRPGSTMPTGIEEGRRYFTTTTTGLTRQISVSQGGASVDFSSDGSGEIMYVSQGLGRMKWDELFLDGNLIKGLNGVAAVVQQPSVTSNMRIENFPVVGMSVGGQQGWFPNIEVIDCWTGIELAGAQFCYFPAGTSRAATSTSISPRRLAASVGQTGTSSSERASTSRLRDKLAARSRLSSLRPR